MSSLVYKCDYCSDTFDTIELANQHEKECDYSPHNQKCGTCKHIKCNYGAWDCELPNTYKYFDERLNCPYHTKEQ